MSPLQDSYLDPEFENILNEFQELLRQTLENAKKLPELTKNLAELGWYLPMEACPGDTKFLMESVDHAIIDIKMMQIFDRNIKIIEAELVKKFPNRKMPIEAAFRAHKQKEYYLSIPVFFAQTEGICMELLGVRFFKLRNDGSPATIICLSNIDKGSFINLLLEPLKITGTARKKQNPDLPFGINRHDVLHGDSTDYGADKVNSYKTLSLLNYIGETVYKAKEYVERHSIEMKSITKEI